MFVQPRSATKLLRATFVAGLLTLANLPVASASGQANDHASQGPSKVWAAATTTKGKSEPRKAPCQPSYAHLTKTTYKNWKWVGSRKVKDLGTVGAGVINRTNKTLKGVSFVVSQTRTDSIEISANVDYEVSAVVESMKMGLSVSVRSDVSTSVTVGYPRVDVPPRSVVYLHAYSTKRQASGTFVVTDVICNKILRTGVIKSNAIVEAIAYGHVYRRLG